MSPVPDIRISTPVRELLSGEMLERILTAPLNQATCPVCARPVPPAGPVNVVLSVTERLARVTFTHLGCAPSSVMADKLGLDDLLPEETGMNMTAMLLAHGTAPLPVLVAERPLHAYFTPLNGPGELTDALVSTLLHVGLVLVPRLRDAPRHLLPWSATLQDHGQAPSQLLIEAGPGELFYEGTVYIAPEWRQAVEQYGWCVLYSGSHISDPETGDPTEKTLRAAAGGGTLVGARLRITWS